MEKRKLLYVLLLSALFLGSCENNVENEDDEPFVGGCETEVSYSATIRPLINSRCMPCHNGDGSEPFAPDLTTFSDVQRLAQQVKAETVTRRMPIGSTLSTAEINDIECWVDNGAPNN